ncbi:hypothetical protein [Halomicrobium salinisoli]|uniref:hypothetical protein n=1 Tax=Halomicrobium salinisoli TaxID=2878391 RepID=UPI001CEFC70D|nr:hypothetical protein [Halomicrobium salinisoli]
MNRLGRVVGYVVLLAAPAALLGATVLAPADAPVGRIGVGSGVVLAGGVAAALEGSHAFDRSAVRGSGRPAAPTLDPRDARTVLSVAAGALVTYALSVHAGLGPVLASALVGLVAGVAAPAIAVPVYCGSFAGMASPSLFPSAAHVGVAGTVAGIAFVASDGVFDGFGGKLGTLAFAGVGATLLLPGGTYATGSGVAGAAVAAAVPVAVVAAVATLVLHVRLDLGAVVGSALVGVAAGAGLPVLLPDLGGTLAAVAFCASFVGMSTTRRLASARQFAAAGAVSGLVFVAVAPAFAGAGGKLGTIAFLSCLTTAGGRALFERL